MINFYMFENMFHFLEPVLTVFAAIAVITLAAVVCIGCIVLAFKVGDSFKGMLEERYAGCRNKWKMRISKFADYVAEKAGVTVSIHLDKIFNLPTKASDESDLREKMVGKWISDNDDEMVITEEDGLYMMSIKYREARISENYLIGLSNIPNNRRTLFLAEGDIPMTIGLTCEQNVVYIPNSNRKFHRTSKLFPSEIQAELDKTFENNDIREEPIFEDTPALSISSETRARILKIINDDNPSSKDPFEVLEDSINRNIIE